MKEAFNVEFEGKFYCICDMEPVKFDCFMSPKSVKIVCLKCNKIYFYRRIENI